MLTRFTNKFKHLPFKNFSTYPKLHGNSILLSDANPPHIRIPNFNNRSSTVDISIDVNETFDHFLLKLKDAGVHNAEILQQGQSSNSHTMGALMARNFNISLNGEVYHVHPQLKYLLAGVTTQSDPVKHIIEPVKNIAPLNHALLSKFTEAVFQQIKGDKTTLKEFNKAVATSLEHFESSLFNDISKVELFLDHLKQELRSLEDRQNGILDQSHNYAHRLISLGIFSVFAQLSGMGAMIYYFYSWDVIEPVTYLLGVFYSVLGMGFFLNNRADFEFKSMEEILRDIKFKKICEQEKFDVRRVEFLREYISTIEKQIMLLKNQSFL